MKYVSRHLGFRTGTEAVYLEAGLESRQSILHMTFPHAFAVAPKENWIAYERSLNLSITSLTAQSQIVYDRCTRVDSDGWRRAPLANVSFLENGRQRVVCIPGTEKKIFRTVGSIDALRNYSKYENDVFVKVSWVEGMIDAFPKDSFSRFDSREYPGLRYMITNVELDGESDLKCFSKSSVELYSVELFGFGVRASFLCHKVTGTNVEYYFGVSADSLNSTREATIKSLTVKNGSLNATLRYIDTLQFEKDMIITAEQIANSEPQASDWHAYGENCGACINGRAVSQRGYLHSLLGRLIYSRADNATLQVPSEQFDVTVISNKLLIIGTVEVAVVLLLGAFMYMWMKRKDLQMPNTLNGLSAVWVETDRSSIGSMGSGRTQLVG